MSVAFAVALATVFLNLPQASAPAPDKKNMICERYSSRNPENAVSVRMIPEAPGDNNSGVLGIVNCTGLKIADASDGNVGPSKIAYIFRKKFPSRSLSYGWAADGLLNFNPEDVHYSGLDHWMYKLTEEGDAWNGQCLHHIRFKLASAPGQTTTVSTDRPFDVCSAFLIVLVR